MYNAECSVFPLQLEELKAIHQVDLTVIQMVNLRLAYIADTVNSGG